MTEAFIPPAPEICAPHLEQLREALEGTRRELEITKRDLEVAQKRELEHQPLFEAIEYVVYRHLERWIDSEHGREILGRVLEDLQGSAIDDALERALSNATVEVEAYLSL